MIATIGWPKPPPRGLPPWNCNANSSMATTLLPPDFKEFLKLLNVHAVEYLLVGGHAVGYHGYPRATVDMDVWTHRTPDNAAKLEAALGIPWVLGIGIWSFTIHQRSSTLPL